MEQASWGVYARHQVSGSLVLEARNFAHKVFHQLEVQKTIDDEGWYGSDGLPISMKADLGGVAYEVGALRTPTNGMHDVVGRNLKFEGYENPFACDDSVFPCSPAGNPSQTLVALARRCAKDNTRTLHDQVQHPERFVTKPVHIPSGPMKTTTVRESTQTERLTTAQVSAPAPDTTTMESLTAAKTTPAVTTTAVAADAARGEDWLDARGQQPQSIP